jgi:hypothetical protein
MSASEEYRKEVEMMAKCIAKSNRGELTKIIRFGLAVYYQTLKLDLATAQQIEDSVLKPYRDYQKKLDRYEEILQKALEEKPPTFLTDLENALTESQKKTSPAPLKEVYSSFLEDLFYLQRKLNLPCEDIEPIAKDAKVPTQGLQYWRNVEKELRSEKNIDYTHLRTSLRAKDWKAANDETTRVLLQVTGGDNLVKSINSKIQDFPCTDLHTIDRLWTQYSNGHFSFTAQMELYANDKVRGRWTYDEATFEKFGDCVGWRKSGKWLTPTEATFNTTAPKGHLPIFEVKSASPVDSLPLKEDSSTLEVAKVKSEQANFKEDPRWIILCSIMWKLIVCDRSQQKKAASNSHSTDLGLEKMEMSF